MKNFIGDPRKKHPIPLRLRNCLVSKDMGGSAGYRGSEFYKKRDRILYRGKRRSSTTGMDEQQDTLEIDHIIPYRISGLTPHTNETSNLRIVNRRDNPFTDYAESGREKIPKRKLKGF